MNILGITNFYSSLDPLCPQAIQKPMEILQANGYNIKMISPKPYTNGILRLVNAKWKNYKLIRNRTINGIEIFHPQFLEFPRNISKHTAWKRYYNAIHDLVFSKEFGFKPDVLHAHMCYPDGVAIGRLASEMKIPFVITIRGTDLITMENFPAIRDMMLETLKNANKVIFPSLRISNQFHHLYSFSKKNTEIIPNGISIEDFVFEPLTIPDYLKDKTVIVSVCNLDKNKGVDVNIKAISKLLEKYKDVHYTIVGDGSERKYLEDLVRTLNIGNHVTFVGKVSHTEALKFIDMADIFSLPAWKETFGLVYLEAMFLKKPIVATFNDGIDGAATDQVHGYFAHQENVEEVIIALEKLIKDPILRKKLGANGHVEVRDSYTWKSHAAKIDSIYTNLR